MDNKKISYLWLIGFILLFPLLQDIIYLIRFHHLPLEILSSSLVFAPMGLISGALMLYLFNKNDIIVNRKKIIIGFSIAVPISLATVLFAGLIAPPIVASTIFGTLPLIIGILCGYMSINSEKKNRLLITFSILWGILLFPSIFMAFFQDLSVKVSPFLTLIRITLLTLPFEIVISIILSWVLYGKNNFKLANTIILIPFINILLFCILNLIK